MSVTAEPSSAGSAGGHRARRFGWVVASSLYFCMTLELLSLVPVLGRPGVAPGAGLVLLGVTVVHVAANIAVMSWALASLRSGRPRRLPVRRLVCCGLATGLVLAVAAAALGAEAVPLVGYAVGLSWAAVATAYPFRVLAVGAVVIVLVQVVVVAVFTDRTAASSVAAALGALLLLLAVGASAWIFGWMLRVFTELDAARADSARLATLEERLRISRDLHDVFGRTLATVAVKSELAAELARRGRSDEAVAEIGEVRVIADDAGREVRRVLHGYREADLDTELVGARALLAAAGIDCTVRGSAAGLDPVVASELAWVVREAVTSLIRHARPRAVTIALHRDPTATTVSVHNDGAPSGAGVVPGGGLTGMRERLERSGGTLAYEHGDGGFTLRATLPAPSQRARR